MNRREIRKSVLAEVEALAAQEAKAEAWLSAIEPLRAKDPKLHALCEGYIHEGNTQRVITLLRAGQTGGSAWDFTTAQKIMLLVPGSVVVLLVAAAVHALFFDEPARITTPTTACERSLASAVTSFKEELGLGFEVTGELPRHILRDGSAETHYRRDGRRYELAFSPVREDGECQLMLTSHVSGARRVRDRPSGLVELADCECE